MATVTEFSDNSVGQTYRRLRYLAGGALIGMPLLVVLAGFVYDAKFQPSLSDYYFAITDGGLPRTLFITFLAVLGGALLAYRGLDQKDNRIHNFAGAFSLGVALFPMECGERMACAPGLWPMLHFPSAGLLFVSAVVSVGYAGGPKLKAALNKLPAPKPWIKRLSQLQAHSLALMAIGILASVCGTFFFKEFGWLFWVEYAGFFGFGIYWVRFMHFINDANEAGKAMVAASRPSGTPDKRKMMRPTASWELIP